MRSIKRNSVLFEIQYNRKETVNDVILQFEGTLELILWVIVNETYSFKCTQNIFLYKFEFHQIWIVISYTFPIDLILNRNKFVAKFIGKVKMQLNLFD